MATVAVQKGDISSELVKQVPGVRLIETANQEQALENLLGGKVAISNDKNKQAARTR
ncbi:MAG: hypothetical protein M1379_02650 [Firmicutes bacterium]|nr:hypothetical protein [Bacillota bacterium]